ncbi:gamma carbonic anhydrase family protein [Kitasatospora sp. DSM 101779]|uniref:gamma carbonic anhydrase family protein n=1 Tax=Kitasatospora sp. DSM 101779 TaxID=2853165 RepID=UPI0021D8ABCC|nr:gamma carbonic anhydrase family protein [Kitasatospora sp. DSM 101779]MCU7825527.1 gamma carbonic anhydrase family protein [Kitasatospora sp. DSM 101779]
MAEPLIAAVAGRVPAVDPSAFVAPNAVVVGAVTVAARAGIWYGAVLRGDAETITVGADTNIQDNCTLHADPGFPLRLGERISVGHNAVLHGCTVEDDVLVGMGATVLNGARIGAGSLIAAGAVVTQGSEVPPGSLVAGVPATVRRPLTDEERAGIRANAEGYLLLADAHRGVGAPGVRPL